MKLLIDENVSYRILKLINIHFSDSIHVSKIKKGRVTDLEIWEYAKENDYVIVTYDEDFYEWQQLKDYPPRVIWLRFGNAPTKFIADKLIRHKKQIINMIESEEAGVLEIY